jgi:23S rRNA (adenine-N6)-dimethyltransferase
VRAAPWWGWHRLAEPWASELVRRSPVQPGDLVIDVGAGTGALTAPLLEAGARVVAVERHPGRARVLRRRFAGAPVVVVECDAADLRLPRRPFRVVANPPFAVMTALVRRLNASGRLLSADLVVPRYVVRRFDFDVVWSLPPHAFRPPPPTGVSVVRFSAERTAGPPPRTRRRDRGSR